MNLGHNLFLSSRFIVHVRYSNCVTQFFFIPVQYQRCISSGILMIECINECKYLGKYTTGDNLIRIDIERDHGTRGWG